VKTRKTKRKFLNPEEQGSNIGKYGILDFEAKGLSLFSSASGLVDVLTVNRFRPPAVDR